MVETPQELPSTAQRGNKISRSVPLGEELGQVWGTVCGHAKRPDSVTRARRFAACSRMWSGRGLKVLVAAGLVVDELKDAVIDFALIWVVHLKDEADPVYDLPV